jgi:hypothetical protein
MATQRTRDDGKTIGPAIHLRQSSRYLPEAAWLPMPQAPANDNELELAWAIRAFIGRHINWLLPTLALTGFSLTLLFLRS